MSLNEILKSATLDDLDLPENIRNKLRNQNLTEVQKLYSSIQVYKVLKRSSIEGLTDVEMQLLTGKLADFLARQASGKQKETQTPPVVYKPENSARSEVRVASPSQSLAGPLAAWENRLSPLLRKVELIGEIPITKMELDDISSHVRHLRHANTEQGMLQIMKRHFPATFLVFMAGHGIHGYNGGDFWPAYERALNKSINHTDFGQLFEKLLERYGKPQFPDLQEKSMRYVSLILAHGGIPVYCLKDFFVNILLNSATRPQLLALEGDELVDELFKHPSYLLGTDKPVIYFLEYGGKTASNLLDRSRKMLLTWQNTQTLLSADEIGLPPHLITSFAEWTRENGSLSQERASRSRLKRPLLSLDPWGLGVFLFLPAQPVSALNASDLYWKVEAGDYQDEIKARTQRRNDQLQTREITLRIKNVTSKISIRFVQGDNEYEWVIPVYSPEHLILSFDPANGTIQNNMLARETWLLYPNQFDLSVQSGAGSLLEVLPDLPGDWSMFKLECWDLSSAIRVGLLKSGQLFREINVRSQEKVQPPFLTGGQIVPTDLDENPVPLYAGFPPVLCIPLGRMEDARSELSRWRLTVENIGQAEPEISSTVTLADLSGMDCSIDDDTAVVYLAAANLLTSKPTGTFQIAVKGPLGRDITLTLAIAPACSVTGLKNLYIPDRSQGPENVTFSVLTSLLDGLDSLNGCDGLKIEAQNPGRYQVIVPAEVSSVGLLLRRESLAHQFIRVPINLRVKRLRWRLIRDNGVVESWLQKHTTLSVQDLLQDDSPLLIVDLPWNEGEGNDLQLNLLDFQGNVIQQIQPADGSASRRVIRFRRFDLTRIKHSMEMDDSPIFRLDLVRVNQQGASEQSFSLPVLVFTREINLADIQTETYSGPEQNHILVNWQEKKQLRSRALLLWSVYRPWQAPIIENIPDSACGEYEFTLSRKDYADGLYRMKMVVIDPWAPSNPPLFPPEKGCCDMDLTSPQDCLKKLERVVDQSAQFSKRIETALIRQHLGDSAASYRELESCCHNLASATSREILALKLILEQVKSASLEKEFGERVVLPEVLGRLYKDWASGAITLPEFLLILKTAPDFKTWQAQTCEILVRLEDPKIRLRALKQLIVKDIARAVGWILKLVEQSSLSFEEAVELVFEEKPRAIEQLRKLKDDPLAEQLLELLARYNLHTGLPVVRPGSWVLTNAGWGRIEEILDPRTRISVDSFLEGDGKYILSVALNIYETYDLCGEKALINMATNQISFPRAPKIFVCPHCQSFASSRLDIFKNHLMIIHENALPYPGQRDTVIGLSAVQFNMNPQQKQKDL
ncbi:MAG: hypothetical protein NTW32_02520 [Chloroflexi bacterium]|nr:hypothetical protein [Chloroflexota bacterium]